ncbi:MAG: hypothetical protein ACLFSQ_09265 [Candidatus Zixiibacteriota bacterium]
MTGFKQKIIFAVLAIIFLYSFFANALVLDDAYITFRTVEHFVEGRGLVWNAGERVQTFTHPLWMFIMSFFYSLTGDFYYTSIFLSLAFLIATLILVFIYYRKAELPLPKLSLFLLAILSCKSIMDFIASGMAISLGIFLITLFIIKFLEIENSDREYRKIDIFALFLIAALAFINRFDSVLFFFPALLYILARNFKTYRFSLLIPVILGILPAILWELFSLLYFGFPFPNTAYAKALNTAIPLIDKIIRGGQYYLAFMILDIAGFGILLFSIYHIFKRKNHAQYIVFMGIFLKLAFIIYSAASASHMAGRFFAIPLFVMLFLLIKNIQSEKLIKIGSYLFIAFLILYPISSIKSSTPLYWGRFSNLAPRYLDVRYHVQEYQNMGFFKHFPSTDLPDNDWFAYGEEFRQSNIDVHLGGAQGGEEAIGYFAFAAGPDKYIIDFLALADPFLSKLHSCNTSNLQSWKPGHFYRSIPEGYLQTIAQKENHIMDPQLAEYYDIIHSITHDRIFDKNRLWHIININLGKYDHYLEDYNRKSHDKFSGDECIKSVLRQCGPIPAKDVIPQNRYYNKNFDKKADKINKD